MHCYLTQLTCRRLLFLCFQPVKLYLFMAHQTQRLNIVADTCNTARNCELNRF